MYCAPFLAIALWHSARMSVRLKQHVGSSLHPAIDKKFHQTKPNEPDIFHLEVESIELNLYSHRAVVSVKTPDL